MKRIALLLVSAVVVFVPTARAQDHATIGAFVDYFRLTQTKSNFVGLGARVGINASPYVQIEGEMAYDFNKVFTEGFTSTSGGTLSTQNSNIKILHGLFGPKIQTKGPARLFITVKGGFENFRFDPRPATFSGFTSTVDNLRTNNVSAVLYPGGGVEGFIGPVGFRLDVGDEIFFANGAHHNWKATFGPEIRF
jgi:hypothetical protein